MLSLLGTFLCCEPSTDAVRTVLQALNGGYERSE